MGQMSTTVRHHALMLLTSALVSTSFIVSKSIADGLDPVILTLLRFVLATLIVLPIFVWQHGLHLPSRRQLIGYACISLTLTGFFWLMYISLRSTTALNTGVIFTLVPSIASLYSALLLHERLGKYRLLAMLPATIGALWVLFHGSLTRFLSFDLNPGDPLFFGSCLLMALYTPLIKIVHRNEPMTVMTFWILATGSGWLLLGAASHLPLISWQNISFKVWAGTVYLAVFCTVITFFLSQFCTLRIGPTRVVAYSYLYPPFVVLIEWLCGEPLPPIQVIPGVLLIVAAMAVVQSTAETTSE
jgi:drug/metabolite transporter (DMT)-like permease